MMSQTVVRRCADCDHYVPVDVFKGLCHPHKHGTRLDDSACEEFAHMKKCKFCRHYSPKEEYLGMCKEKELTYPDLVARTCEMFEWRSDLLGDEK